jgi:hypothetical protein
MPGGNVEIHKDLNKTAGIPAKIRNEHLQVQALRIKNFRCILIFKNNMHQSSTKA